MARTRMHGFPTVIGDSRDPQFAWVSSFERNVSADVSSRSLQANDNVDPYVASYHSPEPNTVGTVIHLRWTGLLPPDFTHGLLQTSL